MSNKKHNPIPYFIAGVLLVLTLIFSVNIIPEGNRGVKTRFGAIQSDKPINPGIHFTIPYIEDIKTMNIRYEMMNQENLSIKTTDGVNIKASASVRYRLSPENVTTVYSEYGVNYTANAGLKQEFKDALKNVADRYSEEIYKGKRTEYTVDVAEVLRESMNSKGINIDTIQLKNMDLPRNVETAINEKIAKKHELEAKERQINIETKEAERKKVEAKGIKDAMQEIQNGLSGQSGKRYISYYWIKEGLQKGDPIYVTGNPSNTPGSDTDIPLYKDIDSFKNKTEQ